MKEKDLEKCLDNLIIKGLIREAEQDNADFETAMRNMSDEDFLALIYDGVENPIATPYNKIATSYNKEEAEPTYKDFVLAENQYASWSAPSLNKDEEDLCEPEFSLSIAAEGFGDAESDMEVSAKRRNWKPWIAAIVSAAALLLIILIPAYNSMDSRVCESALLASVTDMTPSRGGDDIVTMPKEEVKAILPELKKQYSASLKRDEGIRNIENPEDKEEDYYQFFSDPQEAGMELVQAYLRLNKKEKAIEVLRQLSDKYKDSEFGDHCNKLLEILE